MPYCVNCGVELSNTARRCPLCDTEVVLPAGLRSPAANGSLPQQRDVAVSAFDKRLWIQVVSIVMVIPALISVVLDAISGDGLTWSLYVAASLGAVWVWCVSPFLYRRNIVPLWIALDTAALLGLLYVVNGLPPSGGWFVPLALPISLGLGLLTLLVVGLARNRILRELHIVAATLMSISAFCMLVEAVVDLYLTGALRFQWSLLVLASCVPLALIAVVLQRRRPIVEGMKMWLRM